jgi:hypothetical protein
MSSAGSAAMALMESRSSRALAKRALVSISGETGCLVHGQPGVLKEMSDKFEGIKIKRSQPSAAPTECVSSGVGRVLGVTRSVTGCIPTRERGNDQGGGGESVTWRSSCGKSGSSSSNATRRWRSGLKPLHCAGRSFFF